MLNDLFKDAKDLFLFKQIDQDKFLNDQTKNDVLEQI